MLRDIAPGNVPRPSDAVLRCLGIAFIVEGVVLVLDAVGEQQVLLAPEWRCQPVHDPQDLFDLVGTVLLQDIHRDEAGAKEGHCRLAILRGEGVDHGEARRWALLKATLPEIDVGIALTFGGNSELLPGEVGAGHCRSQ